MFSNGAKLRNVVIEFYYILILIKVSFAGEFIDLIKLSSSNSYFIILDTGLYIYDFNNILDCCLIHQFNINEYREDTNNSILLSELNYIYKAYIFCLVNENLFIYNEYTNKLLNYKIKEIVNFNDDDYYNIMPYKLENNNISFIIAYNNDSTNLFFYFYNFDLNDSIIEANQIIFKDMNIQNKMIRCQINSFSTFIICFYYSNVNEQNYLVSTKFYIKDMNLIKEQTSNLFNKEINQIKIAKSNSDKFLVCISNSSYFPECFINYYNNQINEFREINCTYTESWNINYKVFYFNETNDFMHISRYDLTTTILSNADNSIKQCEKQILSDQENEYSIIYNNGYNFVNYQNFSNIDTCLTLSIFEKNKYSKYVEKIKNSIDDSLNKEDLIENLNDFIKNDININYIDENEELIILKDEMTIAFTSTNIQKMNENSNSTTINLGKCEKELKNIYNISEDKNLYMLKIDTNQEVKNYPLIEYEVFYPLNNGKMELLNLSFCKGIDIEISIPIIINDTFDKYNPKSNYYNDICSKTSSESNTDIPLGDRRNEFIKNNMSLCEENCELTSYDNIYKKAKCSCNVKTSLSLNNIELDNKNILKNFIDIKKITNIEIIKCYKIVFKINNLKNNYGFIIIFFIFILYLICITVFYCKSFKILIYEIIKITTIINSKEYLIYRTRETYSFLNIIQSDRKTKLTKTEIDSFTNIIKKEKYLLSKKNKRKSKNRKNWKINKNKDKIDNIIEKNEIKANYKYILEYTDSELDSLSYKEALRKDKRTYCQYYLSLLKKKQPILFSFYPNKDYNSQIIKLFLFFFFFASDITVNALFFTDDTMHKIYVDSGKFNFMYQLPQIIYSYLISSGINFIIEYLSLSENDIISIKSRMNINPKAINKIINDLKIKFCFFFIITLILLLFFCYYISCFCCIYQNTQMHLLKDSLMGLGLSSIMPFFINLIPGIFRIPALRNKKGNKLCMYKFSQIIEFF